MKTVESEVPFGDALLWWIDHLHDDHGLLVSQLSHEFDRSYRTLSKEQGYQNRNLLFIAGLNIDISPREDQVFTLTKFIPWAAYVQSASSEHRILEQRELYDALMASDSENPHKIDLEEAIAVMEKTKEVSISFEFRKSG